MPIIIDTPTAHLPEPKDSSYPCQTGRMSTLVAAEQTDLVRIEIHVRPGASVRRVGGTYDGVLLVRVTERADRGRATAAALQAVAEALGVPRRMVRIVHGASSRRKIIEITTGSDSSVEQQIAKLQGLADDGGP